ncbi:DUF6113 family protein [Actinomadura hibisca]|uniref:DUF6113 family protein n=1 Tax=Actinomadura hibisca TaxID=68565 RepID=UPI00082C1454|nr:DUF6113 family protein [Actinomadura hibisca]
MDDSDEPPVILDEEQPPAGATADGPRAETPVDAFVSGAAYAALALLALVVAVLGAFAQDWTLGSVPVAAIGLVAANFVFVRLAGWAMGARLGAVIPAVVWSLVVFLLSVQRPEGDLVIPGTTPGYVFIVGGMVAAVIAAGTTPTRRPAGDWLTRGIGPTRG